MYILTHNPEGFPLKQRIFFTHRLIRPVIRPLIHRIRVSPFSDGFIPDTIDQDKGDRRYDGRLAKTGCRTYRADFERS